MFLIRIRWSLGVTLAVIGLSVMKSVDQDTAHFISLDKVVHFSMYFVLTFMWAVEGLKQYRFRWWRYNSVKLSLIFCILLGVVLELVQLYLLPDRDFDYYDVLANTLGAIGALIFFRIIYGKVEHYTS